MANIQGLFKDTAIYGLSSIVGRFLNYMMVPLYTYTLKQCSDYGIVADLYAQVALLLVILTFGMETTFFRFINKTENKKERDRVYSTSLIMVGSLALVFALTTVLFITPIATALGYAEHKWYVGMLYLCVAQDAFQAIMFAFLRYQHKPYKFAAFKLFFIGMSVSLNLVVFLFLPKENPEWQVNVKWIFVINLLCTSTVSLLMAKEWTCVKWIFDKKIAKQMLFYTWPLLILGIAGILNQVAGQILLPRILEKQEGRTQLGIYEACIKVAMIMALITQAFRYAYEPIVFGTAKQKNSKELYAKAMKYFLVFTFVAFLCVIGYMDILQYIVGKPYRVGLGIIPVAMAAEIMMGVTVNLSFWYKLIDKTIYGAYFSIAGCIVLFAIDILLIPKIGYWACAWGGFAGYGATMLLSYFLGQKHNPINYPLGEILFYTILAGILFCAMLFGTSQLGLLGRLGLNTLIILIFLVIIFKKEKIADSFKAHAK